MRAGGGADAGDRAPAAARGWELAGARLTGVPGLEDERILAREGLRTTRNPPVQLEQSSQAWTGLAMARGGRRGGTFAGTGVGRFWGSGPSAKRKGPVYGFSPRVRGGRSSSGVASAASSSGGARTASGKRSKQRCVGLLDCPNRLRMCLWGRYGGQGGREPTGGEEILGDRLTGGGGSRQNSGAAG